MRRVPWSAVYYRNEALSHGLPQWKLNIPKVAISPYASLVVFPLDFLLGYRRSQLLDSLDRELAVGETMEFEDSIAMRKGGCGFDVCGLKYISHPHRFVYFEVPKTGTTSLKGLLTQVAAAERMPNRLGFLEYPDYRRFAFVRNPWDRLLSCYLEKIKKDQTFENQNFTRGIPRKFLKFGDAFFAGMSFVEFARVVSKIPDKYADGHFASQHPRLIMDNELVIDHLGRFEDFWPTIQGFLELVGVKGKIEVPHLNSSSRKIPSGAYYNQETLALVRERFAEDLRLFQYDFEQSEEPEHTERTHVSSSPVPTRASQGATINPNK